MKRKLFTLLVIIGGLGLTSCQEDPTMDELILDTEMTTGDRVGGNGGSGGDGGSGDGDGGVGG